jgi:hypothetical protein
MIPIMIVSVAVLIAVFAALALCVSKSRPLSRSQATPAPDEGVLSGRPSSRATGNATATLKSDHTAVDVASPRDSVLNESPHGHSSKFASRFSSKVRPVHVGVRLCWVWGGVWAWTLGNSLAKSGRPHPLVCNLKICYLSFC